MTRGGRRYIVTQFWLVEREVEVTAKNAQEAVRRADQETYPREPLGADNGRHFEIRSMPKPNVRRAKDT